MDARVRKLAAKGLDPEVAEALVAAGYDNPRKIKDATNKELEAVVGRAARKAVREAL